MKRDTDGDSGVRDQTAGSTTDDGTATDTDHGTGTYSDTTTVTSPTLTASSGVTNGDLSDDFGTDKYDVTGTGRTDKDGFDNEDRPSGTLTTQTSYTAPGDPGTNYNSNETIADNDDDTDDGTEDQTNGNVTGETDDFTDTTNGTDGQTYTAASDQGAASALVQPGVPALTYTRILVWLGVHGSGQYLAGGYSGPTTTSGTASLTSNDTDNGLSDGTITDTNGTVNTDEDFSDIDKSKDTATVSTTTTAVNPAPGNDYASTYTGTETQNGTDNSGGTIDGGVTKDNYDDTGTQIDTISGGTTSDGTSSSNGVSSNAHSTSTLSGTDTQTDTESGDYTTEPPGTTPPAPTPDNPNGYAISDQTIDDSENATRTETHTYSGGTNGASSSLTYNGDYTAKETLSIGSDSTVNVNVAQNEDKQSGGYGSNATESQVGNYHEQGSSTSTHVDMSWTMDNHQEHSGYSNDGGSYGGTDGDSQGSQSLMTVSDTTTYTYKDPTTGAVAGSYTISNNSNGSGGGSNSTTGNAPPAPVDGQAGGGAIVIPKMASISATPHGDATVRFTTALEAAARATPVQLVADRGGTGGPTGTSVFRSAVAQTAPLRGGRQGPTVSGGSTTSGSRVRASLTATDSLSRSFWQALASGDIDKATFLLQQAAKSGITIGVRKGVAPLAALLQKVYDKYPAASGDCQKAASKIAEIFQKLGQNPVQYKITDALNKGGNTWTAPDGTIFTKRGFHQVVVVGGRVYDAITGPAGMTTAEYQKMLLQIGLRKPSWAQLP